MDVGETPGADDGPGRADVARRLHEAEAALRRSEDQFAAFVRNIPCAAFVKEPAGRYLLVSERLERIRAIEPGSWIGKTDADIFPPDVAERLAACDRAVVASGERSERIEDTPHADGTRQWLVSRFPIPVAGGPPLLGGIALDIASHGRAEQERADLVECDRAARHAAERAVSRLEAIQTLTDATLAHMSLDAMLHELLGRVRGLLGTDTATILLADDGGTTLSVRATSGLASVPQASVPIGQGVAGTVAATRTTFSVEDVSTTEMMHSVVSRAQRSLLGAPLLIEGRAIGVLKVGSVARRQFTADEARLLQVVADRVAPAIDRARLCDELVAARRRLEALSQSLLDVQEAERRRIARELHDEIGQLLTGLKLRIEARESAARGAETREIVNEVMGRVRAMSMNLMPPMLDDLGLAPALMWHVERYTAQTRVRVRFRHAGLDRRFAPEVELTAFRVAQEALTNVARHTGVAEARLDVWATADGLGVQVEDDGPGFDAEAAMAGPSVGLAGMRERVRLVGGRFSIESGPCAGTRLSAVLPLGAGPATGEVSS